MSKDFAERSSFSHWVVWAENSSGVRPIADVITVPSGPIVAGVPDTGRLVLPSKWPQNPFASTASRKRISKIAQLVPVISSLGTEEGSVLERDVAVIDMVSTRFHKYEQRLILGLCAGGGAHNLLDFLEYKAQLFAAQTTDYINYTPRVQS